MATYFRRILESDPDDYTKYGPDLFHKQDPSKIPGSGFRSATLPIGNIASLYLIPLGGGRGRLDGGRRPVHNLQYNCSWKCVDDVTLFLANSCVTLGSPVSHECNLWLLFASYKVNIIALHTKSCVFFGNSHNFTASTVTLSSFIADFPFIFFILISLYMFVLLYLSVSLIVYFFSLSVSFFPSELLFTVCLFPVFLCKFKVRNLKKNWFFKVYIECFYSVGIP